MSSLVERRSDVSMTPGNHLGFGGQPVAQETVPEPGSRSQPSPHPLGSAHDAKNISEARTALPPRPCTPGPRPLSRPVCLRMLRGGCKAHLIEAKQSSEFLSAVPLKPRRAHQSQQDKALTTVAAASSHRGKRTVRDPVGNLIVTDRSF